MVRRASLVSLFMAGGHFGQKYGRKRIEGDYTGLGLYLWHGAISVKVWSWAKHESNRTGLGLIRGARANFGRARYYIMAGLIV